MATNTLIRASTVFAQAIGATPHVGDVHCCGLCGMQQSSKPWRSVLKDTYTTQLDLKTEYVCWACEAGLNDRRSRSNVLIDSNGAYSRPIRKDVWQLLQCPPKPPFLLYLTLSGKKHGLWKQQVAHSRTLFRVQCEDAWFMFSPKGDGRWMQVCHDLVKAGVRRQNVLSGRFASQDYAVAGVSFLRSSDDLYLSHIRGSQKFFILMKLLPGGSDL